MAIPNFDQAHVPASKLVHYLLDTNHPVGKSKAWVFRRHGYEESNKERLESDLLRIARTAEAEVVETPYGLKYIATGDIITPVGKIVSIRTIWIMEPNDPRPRFITAYPV